MRSLCKEDKGRSLVFHDTAKAKPRTGRHLMDDLLRDVAEVHSDQAEAAALQKHVGDLECLFQRPQLLSGLATPHPKQAGQVRFPAASPVAGSKASRASTRAQ